MLDQYAAVLGFSLYVVHLCNLIDIAKQILLCLLEFGHWVVVVWPWKRVCRPGETDWKKQQILFQLSRLNEHACQFLLHFMNCMPYSQLLSSVQLAAWFLLCFMVSSLFACLFHTHVGIYASVTLRMQRVLLYLQILFEFGTECLSNSVCSRTILWTYFITVLSDALYTVFIQKSLNCLVFWLFMR